MKVLFLSSCKTDFVLMDTSNFTSFSEDLQY